MKLFFLLFFFEFSIYGYSQITYPKNYFQAPIAKEYSISGNFGEIRPAHFHSGFDYGTKKKVGINVYAVADGYISRVKVSSKGYGKALYITHPNGYVSVYAHLNQFGHLISDYVYKVQHEKQQFEIDEYLYPGEFKVKKGQVIAKSGNTGRSFGPHLHFEIRDEKTEEPINPLFFGYHFPDTESPVISDLYMYYFSKGNEESKYLFSEKITKPGIDTIRAFGTIGFGINTTDYNLKKKKETYAVYQIEMYIDDSLYFKSRMDRIAFDDSKYLNSFIDYDLYRDKGLKISKCYVEPNNKLKIYKARSNGLYSFCDGKLHQVKIVVRDYNWNSTDLLFYLQSDSSMIVKAPQKNKSILKVLDYHTPNDFVTDSFSIHFPDSSLYYHVDFKYSKSKVGYKKFSDYHHIHNQYVPLHNSPVISIKPYVIPDLLKQKAIIVGIGRNQHLFSEGGKWNGDFIETKISSFGSYYVDVDTVAPDVIPISLKKSNTLKSDNISFTIKDNLSGISSYVSYIDNKWVLFEYDEKSKTISCNLPSENIEPGEHKIVIWVEDQTGNIGSFESNFIY